MLGSGTAGKSLEQLQRAVMGMDPTIQPFEALGALQKMVKSKEMQAAQMAQQPTPQGSVAQRKIAEAAALRNPYMASGLGAAPVPSFTGPQEPAPQPTPGMAGGGMVAFAKGGDTSGYSYDYTAQTPEDQIAAMQKYKAGLGSQNDEFLAPIKQRLAEYEEDAKKKDKYSINDALIAAGLGMMAGKSQYAMQNIGEGGLKGLAAYQESQRGVQGARDKMLAAQNDLAKSRIALEKGDETTAAALANQARQEQQTAATLQLQSQHYANADKAAMAAANARVGLGGMLTPYQYGQLRDKASDNVKGNKNFPMQLMQARAAAKKAGQEFNEQQFTDSLIEQEFQKMLRNQAGGATIPQATPGAGAGGNQRVIDFGSIGNQNSD
jgi:hypothetical protein